jgi:hypothetical protein
VLVATAAVHSAVGAAMNRILLPNSLVTSIGARCMDGTAGGYYLTLSHTNTTKYVIYIEGGGECRTKSDCQQW